MTGTTVSVIGPNLGTAATFGSIGGGAGITLDGQGDSNAIWVFQMASALLVGDPGTPRNVILTNGAQAKNVFWQVGSSATINAASGGTMVGTIIASAGSPSPLPAKQRLQPSMAGR